MNPKTAYYLKILVFASTILVALYTVNGMLYNPWGYTEVTLFSLTFKNHNFSLFTMIILFYVSYIGLSHLDLWKQLVFSGVICVSANELYDLLWNVYYLASLRDGNILIPPFLIQNIVSLIGITFGLTVMLWLLHRDYRLFTFNRFRLIQLITALFVTVCLLTSLYLEGFYTAYHQYILYGTADPHNLIWAVSRITAFISFVPLLRWKSSW